MVRFLATNKETGKQVAGFGLSAEDIKHTEGGNPLAADMPEINPFYELRIIIFRGDSEADVPTSFREIRPDSAFRFKMLTEYPT